MRFVVCVKNCNAAGFFMLNSFPCVLRMVRHPKDIQLTWHNRGKRWSQHGPASQLNIRKVFLMFGVLSVCAVYRSTYFPFVSAHVCFPATWCLVINRIIDQRMCCTKIVRYSKISQEQHYLFMKICYASSKVLRLTTSEKHSVYSVYEEM